MKKSIYFHGLGWSIEGWKAQSFKKSFDTKLVPWGKNYDEAFRYYKDNFFDIDDVILIWNSAGVLPIINICYHYPEKISKVVLLNPATSMMNMNVIPDTINVVVYSWTNDYGRNVYMQWDNPLEHIKVHSIPGNHDFRGREDMINDIIRWELS